MQQIQYIIHIKTAKNQKSYILFKFTIVLRKEYMLLLVCSLTWMI